MVDTHQTRNRGLTSLPMFCTVATYFDHGYVGIIFRGTAAHILKLSFLQCVAPPRVAFACGWHAFSLSEGMHCLPHQLLAPPSGKFRGMGAACFAVKRSLQELALHGRHAAAWHAPAAHAGQPSGTSPEYLPASSYIRRVCVCHLFSVGPPWAAFGLAGVPAFFLGHRWEPDSHVRRELEACLSQVVACPSREAYAAPHGSTRAHADAAARVRRWKG